MNYHAEAIFENAKKFDDKYVKAKSTNIYCSSETMINDYLLAKSLVTDNLISVIVTNPSDMGFYRSALHLTLQRADMLHRYNDQYKSHIKFKNGSRIHIFNSDNAHLAIRGYKVDLLYLTNAALHPLFYSSGITTFYPALSNNGRIIFNFDP